MSQTWFISGCSSGLGYAMAAVALESGHRVVMGARRAERLQPLLTRFPKLAHAVALDVTDHNSIRTAVAAAIQRFEAIDVLVNNAGILQVGAIEETSDGEMQALFATNFFGALELTRAILPGMRSRRSGCVVNISSTGGIATAPGIGGYCATKHALEAISESMAAEVAPLGIKVLIVEPGAFRTEVGGKATIAASAIADYQPIRDFAQTTFLAGSGKEPGDPYKAAAVILSAVERKDSPLRLPVGLEAFGAIRGKLAQVIANFDACESIAPDVRYPGEPAVP